jgi:hypothetical protein
MGLVIPDRLALLRRLNGLQKPLESTLFKFEEHRDFVEATCPWGNRMRCYTGDRFAGMLLGMPFVEFDVPRGTAQSISQFYRSILSAISTAGEDNCGSYARIAVGPEQHLIFREGDFGPRSFDGHHVAIYLANFSGPHRQLFKRGLITEESNEHQYRFQDIVDLENGRVLFTVEHEVRSMRHPLYARPLVNRNPARTTRAYAPGHEELSWATPPAK